MTHEEWHRLDDERRKVRKELNNKYDHVYKCTMPEYCMGDYTYSNTGCLYCEKVYI